MVVEGTKDRKRSPAKPSGTLLQSRHWGRRIINWRPTWAVIARPSPKNLERKAETKIGFQKMVERRGYRSEM